MKTITKSIEINAAPDVVWNVLLSEETYPIWADSFSPGSGATATGNWEEGSEMTFGDGQGMALTATVTEHVPNASITMKFTGETMPDGTKNTEGGMVDSIEKYTVTETEGGTRLDISSDMMEEYFDMMSAAWDTALAKVKELAEKQ